MPILIIGVQQYISGMSRKPFIIKTKVVEPMIPVTSEMYDEVQESRMQMVQAANGYLTISMLYESFKLMWSFWHYKQNCADYAYLSLGFMGINIIWAICSYLGFRAIKSKNSRNIRLYAYSIITNFILRIIMYSVVGVVMKGYARRYIEITAQQYNDIICNVIYPQALYVISGCIETLICLILLYLTRSLYTYVVKWENSEVQKHMPIRLNDLSDY